jgi:hypothetical protein
MDFKKTKPFKRSLRSFGRVQKNKHRPLNFSAQNTVTRGDYGPKEKPITIQADTDMRHCFDEGKIN